MEKKDIDRLYNLIQDQHQQFVAQQQQDDAKDKLIEALRQENAALQQENDSLKKLIHTLPGNIVWKGRDHRYKLFNQNALSTLGLKSNAEVTGQRLSDLTQQAHVTWVEEMDEQVMTSAQEMMLEEHVRDSHDHPKTFLSIKKPTFNEQGEVDGMLLVSFDITERKIIDRIADVKKRKNLIEKIKDMKLSLEKEKKAKKYFRYNMEHDLRTPTSGIIGLAEIMQMDETDIEKIKNLELMKKCGEELMAHFNAVLEFSNASMQWSTLSNDRIDVKKMMQHILDLQGPVSQAKHIPLTINIDPTIPSTVIGDQKRLFAILINLISNAIKFTDKGSVTIEIAPHAINEQAGEVVLRFSVTDTGIGIPEDKQTLILQPYTRLTPSNKGMYPGFGLGLYLVNKYISELNGKLELHSVLEQGSIFIFIIPLQLPLSN